MKIKLISPRMSLRPMDSVYKRLLSPPLSLVTIATLTPKEHTVWIEDENVGKIKLTDNPDLVGITVNVDTSESAFEIARYYRNRGINFIGNIEWARKFVQTIKNKGFIWHAAVSANIFYHKDLIREFAKSGCKNWDL